MRRFDLMFDLASFSGGAAALLVAVHGFMLFPGAIYPDKLNLSIMAKILHVR
jgi:hypothetical protein